MSDEPTKWSLQGFCEHFQFVHEKMPDHKFVWVLGAGASRASGIPTGGQLVERWLRELKVRHAKPEHEDQPLADWATADNLKISGFKYKEAASFYPKVYERRFGEYPEEGYACLEDLMSGIDPSPGYSILAAALAEKRHSAVITTNFDNLVADALSIYTETFPFVCGHESLARLRAGCDAAAAGVQNPPRSALGTKKRPAKPQTAARILGGGAEGPLGALHANLHRLRRQRR
jgi:hypothetical protein